MKIAFFLAHYPLPGGTTKAVRGLARALSRLGQNIYILCLGERNSKYREERIIVRRFRKSPIPRTLPQDLFTFLAKEKFDLVILNGMFMPELALLAWWLSRIKIPFVVAPHGPYHPELLKKNDC